MPLMRKVFVSIIGLVKLMRPQNCLAALGLVFLGAFLTGMFPNMKVFVASIVVVFILGGCNIFNDYEDIEIDRINKPYRPLPSNQVLKRTALFIACSLIASGWLISYSLGIGFSIITFFCATIGVLYSMWLKNIILVGNIAVAALSAFTILYGGLLGSNSIELLTASVAIFLFMLAREILKLVDDHKGDQAKKLKTVSTIYGQRQALQLSILLFGTYLIVGIIPFWTLSLSRWYLVITIVAINLKLAVLCIHLWRSLTPNTVKLALRLTKSDFYIWCIALLLGKLL
jgi:geranylgeranylglycerol-phosphate geranylgeranyltransferase